MTVTNESRRAERFEVQLSCRVSSPGRTFQEKSGVTRNISRSGVLVFFDDRETAEAPPEVGDPIRITLNLPHNPRWSRRCLDCVATVVRVNGLDRGVCEVGCEIVRIRVREADAYHGHTPAPALVLSSLGLLQ